MKTDHTVDGETLKVSDFTITQLFYMIDKKDEKRCQGNRGYIIKE